MKVGRSAGTQHQLMMLGRLARHEYQAPGRQIATIGNEQSENSGIEVFHSTDVGDEDANMAEREACKWWR